MRPDLEKLETTLIDEVRDGRLPEVPLPLNHLFAPGVYVREIFMPKDTFVVGREHKTEHFNVVLTGRANVLMGDKVHHVIAPSVFVSKPGLRKVLLILEDMRWLTIHPTEETDIDKLEDMLVVNSPAFLEERERKKLLCHSQQ